MSVHRKYKQLLSITVKLLANNRPSEKLMDYIPLYSRQITCPWSILPHFQALRRGHFSTPYNGHRVQPIQNDLWKRTVKVPPTNKLYIMWRFVQHLGGGGWPFVPCSQCKEALNSARLVQIRSRSSVTFQSRFFKGFVSLYFRLK